METIVGKEENVRHKIKDIALDVSWSKVSKRYFGKSASWLYHKLDGIDGQGNPNGGFSQEEKKQFKGGLYDLADRIRKTADSI